MSRRLPTLGNRPRCASEQAAAQTAQTRAQHHRHYDARRGNSAARGYDRHWRKSRALWLGQHPLCAVCESRGQYVAATLVDHITPVRSAEDALFYDTANWQSLCRACHAAKTAADSLAGKTRRACSRPKAKTALDCARVIG